SWAVAKPPLAHRCPGRSPSAPDPASRRAPKRCEKADYTDRIHGDALALWASCPYMNGGKNARQETTCEDRRPKYSDQSEVKGSCSQGCRNGSAHALVVDRAIANRTLPKGGNIEGATVIWGFLRTSPASSLGGWSRCLSRATIRAAKPYGSADVLVGRLARSVRLTCAGGTQDLRPPPRRRA